MASRHRTPNDLALGTLTLALPILIMMPIPRAVDRPTTVLDHGCRAAEKAHG
jgi:hypothetical protein